MPPLTWRRKFKVNLPPLLALGMCHCVQCFKCQGGAEKRAQHIDKGMQLSRRMLAGLGCIHAQSGSRRTLPGNLMFLNFEDAYTLTQGARRRLDGVLQGAGGDGESLPASGQAGILSFEVSDSAGGSSRQEHTAPCKAAARPLLPACCLRQACTCVAACGAVRAGPPSPATGSAPAGAAARGCAPQAGACRAVAVVAARAVLGQDGASSRGWAAAGAGGVHPAAAPEVLDQALHRPGGGVPQRTDGVPLDNLQAGKQARRQATGLTI